MVLWHAGYRQACEAAKERLELLALNHSSNEDTFRQDLLNIAKTTLRCTPLLKGASESPCCVLLLALLADALKRQHSLLIVWSCNVCMGLFLYAALRHTEAQSGTNFGSCSPKISCMKSILLLADCLECTVHLFQSITSGLMVQLQDSDARQGALCQAGCGCRAEAEGQQQPGKHTHHQEDWRHTQGTASCNLQGC